MQAEQQHAKTTLLVDLFYDPSSTHDGGNFIVFDEVTATLYTL